MQYNLPEQVCFICGHDYWPQAPQTEYGICYLCEHYLLSTGHRTIVAYAMAEWLERYRKGFKH